MTKRLARALSRGNTDAGPWLERVRVERLRALLAARDFDSARRLAREILSARGLEPLGGAEFLRYYVETDRSGRRIHAMMGRVLLAPDVAETLEETLVGDTRALCLLGLARIKLALLEGDMASARDLLARADAFLHGLPEEEFTTEIARWQIYLWLFQAKYQERLGAWDPAVGSYETAQGLLAKYWPDNDFLVFEVARTVAELRTGKQCPELLDQVLLVERGLGDPILNPTDDEAQLRLGARNLLERLRRGGDPCPLRAFVWFHVGRHLGRAGDEHVAEHFLARARSDAGAPEALRQAVLWEEAGLFDLGAKPWLRASVCGKLASLGLPPAQSGSVRLREAEARLVAGQAREARRLAWSVQGATRLETLRLRAAQVLALAGEGGGAGWRKGTEKKRGKGG